MKKRYTEEQIIGFLREAGDEYDRLRVVAMRERYAGVRGAAGGGGDTGHDLERDALFRERRDLFAAAA